MAAPSLRGGVLVVVFLFSSTFAVPPPTNSEGVHETRPTWRYGNCFEFTGNIYIHGADISVPQNATVCGSCDDSDPYLMLKWDTARFLLLFLRVNKAQKTFELEEIQYLDGTNFYVTKSIIGVTGVYDGTVGCKGIRVPLNPSEQIGPYGCDPNEAPATDKTRRHGANERKGQVPEQGDQASVVAAVKLDDIAHLGNDSAIGGPDEDDALAVEEVVPGPSGGENNGGPSGEGGSKTLEYSVELSQFSLTYSSDIDNHQDLHHSSCRVEPDLTIILSVSGLLSAVVLLALAAVALRLSL